MSSQPTAQRPVRFGLFELDLAAGELRKQGRKIKFQDQPLQVLALLLRRPGEIVTREELQQALWPADTFIEFDQGVNTAIKKIRQALGDSAENPRFIETIPRKGYRFIAPVEARAPLVQMPLRPRRWIWLASALATAVVVGALVIVALNRHPPEPSERVVPLTTYPGFEYSPSFSPDGNEVAFRWDSHIYVKQVGEERALPLTSGSGWEIGPAWSPDGSSIAFLRHLPDGGDVLLIPALGGPERKVGRVRYWNEDYPGPSWTPDGKWLAIADGSSVEEGCSIFLLSVETGEKRRLTWPPPNTGDVTPAVSPDGRWLAFARYSEVYLLALSPNLTPIGEPKRIALDGRISRCPAWTRDSREIIFQSGPQHLPVLWRATVFGDSKPRRLTYTEPIASHPAVSRGKPRLAYVKMIWDVNLWRVTIPAAQSRTTSRSKFAASSYLEHVPQFSPDGTRVAFISNRSGSQQVWTALADGSNPFKLTSFDGPECIWLAWSPDGERIVLAVLKRDEPAIYVIGASGGVAMKIIDDGDTPSWSREGNWIYFSSKRTGVRQIWKAKLTSGLVSGMTQVTKNGGSRAQESADAKFIYYSRDDAVWRATADGGAEVRIAGPLCDRDNFVVARSGIYFMLPPDKKERSLVQRLNFADGKLKTVAVIDGTVEWGMTVSPDEQYLLYSHLDDITADLMLVENFR